MTSPIRSAVFRLEDARSRIPGPAGEHATSVLRRGTLDMKLSMPVPPNEQAPHDQDELYIVVGGRGVLVHDGARDALSTGDVAFVSAGTPHHFEDFGDDLAVWVVFYGPPGGEAASAG